VRLPASALREGARETCHGCDGSRHRCELATSELSVHGGDFGLMIDFSFLPVLVCYGCGYAALRADNLERNGKIAGLFLGKLHGQCGFILFE
jgi:hypothetical protein